MIALSVPLSYGTLRERGSKLRGASRKETRHQGTRRGCAIAQTGAQTNLGIGQNPKSK
ncbi:hypothetical protein [Nostoc sp.]|uniref:hypothetical protein n=1 Tax=Nostoc sp. TaxID=1180 RepID=UPI002FFB0D1E